MEELLNEHLLKCPNSVIADSMLNRFGELSIPKVLAPSLILTRFD